VTPSFYPYRVARIFPIAGTDEERVLYRVYDLLLVPQRGQEVLLPGELEPRRIDRVVQAARPPAKSEAWTPGFTALAWVTVELEPEPADQYETAVAAGWAVELA
jgi:hypothetical protein